ncbi:MAG: tRNA-dependent cyclodipeptide synthase [Candidatus Lokiarchaeota archaeon]|nr:tRNA-dependent cyclodipeptide synthase [Candidatus Lokiarchaeota archaeon]
MSVTVEKIINSDLGKVQSKRYDIFLGISLGNKYFTKENIKEYILWALENTKEKVAVLIVDKIHAVNYEVRNKYSKERALSVAIRHGEEKIRMIEKIVNSLPKERQEKVSIVRWQDIEKDQQYIEVEKIIRDAFSDNKNFYNAIIGVVKENVDLNIIKMDDSDYEKLANYTISELPVLISGFTFQGTTFDLIPYPGIGRIDDLVVEIQNGKRFPSISKALNIKNKCIIVEAYVKSAHRPVTAEF